MWENVMRKSFCPADSLLVSDCGAVGYDLTKIYMTMLIQYTEGNIHKPIVPVAPFANLY